MRYFVTKLTTSLAAMSPELTIVDFVCVSLFLWYLCVCVYVSVFVCVFVSPFSSSLTAMSPEQCWLCGHRLGSICWKNNDWTFPQHSTFSSSSDGQKCWTLWKKNFSNPLWHIWQKHYHKDDLDKNENDGLEKSITCHLWESEHDQSCLRLIWIRFHQSQSSEKGQNTNIVGENIASIIEPTMRMMMGDMDLCKIGGGGPALVYQVAERSWQREGWKQFLVTMTIITMMMVMMM